MRSVRRVLAASIAAVVLVVSAGAAHAEPAPPITWAACQDDPGGECGTLSVPLDWDRPQGRRVDLAIARHKATDPARRLGVLVVGPGGPGGSAAEFALSRLFSPEVRARFDIVGIGQRGTGGSLAIRCADLMPRQPSTYPQDEAGSTALLRHNRTVLPREFEKWCAGSASCVLHGQDVRASVCQDFSLRIRNFREYERMRAEELRRSPIMRGSFLGHDEATACVGGPGRPADPPHRLDIRDAPKIMVINSRHDPTIPHEWAVDIKRQAPRTTALLTYEGWGHIAYPRSACTRTNVDDYLLELRTPAVSCPAVLP